MSNFGVAVKNDIINAINTNREEIQSILGRSLDQTFEMSVEAASDIEYGDWPAEVEKAGLVLSFEVEGQAAVAVLPISTGMVPIWSRKPDATGKSKLDTLALELGMNLLPDEFMPENCRAGWIDDVPAALNRGSGDALGSLHLELRAGDFSGTMFLWLPISGVDELWGPPPAAPEVGSKATTESDSAGSSTAADQGDFEPVPRPVPRPRGTGEEDSENVSKRFGELPMYTRSLLRVKVPVMVHLASTKTDLSNVLNMGPGTLIQFDKGCDELLRLAVAGYEIAEGEAVKVGDKFGLRVSKILLPPERFEQLQKPKRAS